MRYIFLPLFFVFLTFVQAQEAKIVLGSFDTIERADRKLKEIIPLLDVDFWVLQKEQDFDILTRPSGKKFIVTIEPMVSMKEARELRKILPKPFNKESFVGNYSLKTRAKPKKILYPKNEGKSKQENNEKYKLENSDDKKENNKLNVSSVSKSTPQVVADKDKQEKDRINELKFPKILQQKSEKDTSKKIHGNTPALEKNHTANMEFNKSSKTAQKEHIPLEVNKTSSKISLPKVPIFNTNNSEGIDKEKKLIPQAKNETKQANNSMILGKKEKINKTETSFYMEDENGFKRPVGVTFMQAVNHFFLIAKQHTINIISILFVIIKQFLSEIVIFIFIVAVLLFFFAYRRSFLLYNRIRQLKKGKQAMIAETESLKMDIYNLKAYFNDLIDSTRPSLEKLSEYFKDRDKTLEQKESKDAIQNLLNIAQSYDDAEGNVVLSPKEFDLNLLVKRAANSDTIKCDNLQVVVDFNNPILQKIIGDSQKIGRVIITLLAFLCKDQKTSRILIVLNETVQDVKGNVFIKTIIKDSKKKIPENTKKKIVEILNSKKFINLKECDEELVDLVVAKRIIESMHGELQLLDNFRNDSGFVFSMRLDITDRHLIQKNIFSDKSHTKSNILIFGNNAESVKTLQNELEYFYLDIITCFSWNLMLEKFNNIYFFIDAVVIQNATLPFLDIEALNKAAKRKNFITLVIFEEGEAESEELKQIKNAIVLKRPYSKEKLIESLETISYEQRPKISS